MAPSEDSLAVGDGVGAAVALGVVSTELGVLTTGEGETASVVSGDEDWTVELVVGVESSDGPAHAVMEDSNPTHATAVMILRNMEPDFPKSTASSQAS